MSSVSRRSKSLGTEIRPARKLSRQETLGGGASTATTLTTGLPVRAIDERFSVCRGLHKAREVCFRFVHVHDVHESPRSPAPNARRVQVDPMREEAPGSSVHALDQGGGRRLPSIAGSLWPAPSALLSPDRQIPNGEVAHGSLRRGCFRYASTVPTRHRRPGGRAGPIARIGPGQPSCPRSAAGAP